MSTRQARHATRKDGSTSSDAPRAKCAHHHHWCPRGFDEAWSDARVNLRDAVFASVHPNMPPGIYVCFHHRLIDARVVHKRSTTDPDGFGSMNGSDVGRVMAPDTLAIHRREDLFRLRSEPQLRAGFENAVKVESLQSGYEPAWLEAILERPDLRGLVLQVFGMGGIPSSGPRALTPVLKMYAKVKPVVAVTRCIDGPTSLRSYKVGW